jgi:hypothetical protein
MTTPACTCQTAVPARLRQHVAACGAVVLFARNRNR